MLVHKSGTNVNLNHADRRISPMADLVQVQVLNKKDSETNSERSIDSEILTKFVNFAQRVEYTFVLSLCLI